MSKTAIGRVALVPKGAYDPTTTYERLDLIQHEGRGYVALKAVQGVTPTDGEDYMLLADGAAVDATLTQAGAAADAKAVGDKFSALSEEIAKLGSGSGGGLSITDDGEGNVIIASVGSVTITDDGDGNVTIE